MRLWMMVHLVNIDWMKMERSIYTNVKSTDDLAIRLDYNYMKIFEMPVEKISHSPAYLEVDASHEHLKRKGDLNEEEKREKKKLEDEMKEEIATEERLQKEAAVV